MAEKFKFIPPENIITSLGGELPEGFENLSKDDQYREAMIVFHSLPKDTQFPIELTNLAALLHQTEVGQYFSLEDVSDWSLVLTYICQAKEAAEDELNAK